MEQTKELAEKFNRIYSKTFTIPKAILSENKRIPGLDGRKMSKSYNNAIYLIDDEATVSKKVMKAVTDPLKVRRNDPGHPENCNVCKYHKLFNGDMETIERECRDGSRGCVDCKKELIENINKFLKPIQERRSYYEEHPEEVNEIIIKGTKKAQDQAESVMQNVRHNMGIDYFKGE
jgi:tryptophanyl-tRNA synthetase